MRMKNIFQWAIVAVIGMGVFLPRVSLAASCTAQSGQCMTVGDCSHLVQLYPYQSESSPYATDIGKQDCNGSFVTCCKLHDVQQPAPQPPGPSSQCQSQGGRCMSKSVCDIYAVDNSGITSSPSDCDPDNTGEAVCCVGLPADSQGSCTANAGGTCKASCEANDEAMGPYDCTGGQTCCRVRTTAPATTKPGTTSAAAGGPSVGAPPGSLFDAIQSVNPATLTCIKTGNCTVDDIVYAGVGFAKFLMGLSGALFFIIFIYGGALYLTSFGEKGRVDKAKKAITGAAIGIIIVMGAWTIVRYLVGGLTGIAVSGGPTAAPVAGQTSTPNDCSTAFPGYSCKPFPSAASVSDLVAKCQQAGNDCKPGHCSGAKDICAKSNP